MIYLYRKKSRFISIARENEDKIYYKEHNKHEDEEDGRGEKRRDFIKKSMQIYIESELSLPRKSAIKLYHNYGLSCPKIARLLLLNKSTVWRNLRRGEKQIYKAFELALKTIDL